MERWVWLGWGAEEGVLRKEGAGWWEEVRRRFGGWVEDLFVWSVAWRFEAECVEEVLGVKGVERTETGRRLVEVGRREGAVWGLRRAVLAAVEARLGEVPSGLGLRLAGWRDRERLEALVRGVVIARDADAVRRLVE